MHPDPGCRLFIIKSLNCKPHSFCKGAAEVIYISLYWPLSDACLECFMTKWLLQKSLWLKDLLICVLLLTFGFTTKPFCLWPLDKYLLRIMISQKHVSLQRLCRSEEREGENPGTHSESPKVVAWQDICGLVILIQVEDLEKQRKSGGDHVYCINQRPSKRVHHPNGHMFLPVASLTFSQCAHK